MRNLLALIGLVVVGFGAIGWYCGWYKLSVSKGSDGKREVRTTLDTDKVADDSSAFFQKVGKLIEQRAEQAGKDGTPQPAVGPVSTPGPGSKDAASQGGWFLGPTNPGKGQ